MSCKGYIMSLAVSVLMMFPFVSGAQSPALVDRLYAEMSKSCMDMTYTYVIRMSGIDNNGQGTVLSQDLMWKVCGNGVVMYCDSETVWIVDPAMKEVVLEPAPEVEQQQWMSNPAVVFSRLDELFYIDKNLDSPDGKAEIYVMKPRTGSDIDYCNIELNKSDASIRRAAVALSDGTLIKIEVSSMKLTPKLSVEAFRPQTVFDSSWIINDLR